MSGTPLNVMAVVCHPADAIDGAGGTLCLHAERGDSVTVVICTHGVDTHDLERKVRAMDCLTSQFYPGDLARKCIEDVNGRMGLHWRLPYAEAFQSFHPDVYSHLPANDYLLQRAASTAEEELARMRITVTDVPFNGESGSG